MKKFEFRINIKEWKKYEIALAVFLVIIAIVAVIALFMIFREYHVGDAAYRELTGYVILEDEPREVPDIPQETPDVPVPPTVDFDALTAINGDCIGWLYSPGETVINYPVVQGQDNDYYQSHTFDRVSNKCGGIFLDMLNEPDFSDQNSIIYGHHMKNGTMFASLVKYTEQAYYDEHPYLWLVTPEKTYMLRIFSGFLTDTESDVWQLSFSNSKAYQDWLNEVSRKSNFKSELSPGITDHIVTLATCSYESGDARYVLMGILEEY